METVPWESLSPQAKARLQAEQVCIARRGDAAEYTKGKKVRLRAHFSSNGEEFDRYTTVNLYARANSRSEYITKDGKLFLRIKPCQYENGKE